jgi:hypothetical protein
MSSNRICWLSVFSSILVKKVKNKQKYDSIHINATKLQEIYSTQPLKPHH